jgi:hypothetical protein
MKLLVAFVALIAVAFSLDASCKDEYKSQKNCFMEIGRYAFGVDDDVDMSEMKELTKQCFIDHGCRLPPNMDSSSSSSEEEDEDEEDTVLARHRRSAPSFMRDFVRMKKCVDDDLGRDSFDAIKECVQERTGNELPPFMKKPPRLGLSALQNKKCPYLRLMKFLAISPQMPKMTKRLCHNDQAKTDALVACIDDAIGVDIMNLNRDEIKDRLCERKDDCYTPKLTQCRDDIQEMIEAACACKTELCNDAMTTCAEELDVTLPEELTMPCDDLMEKMRQKFDMCHESFAWPTEEELRKMMRKRKGHGKRVRRHGHGHHDRHGHDCDGNHDCDACNDDADVVDAVLMM